MQARNILMPSVWIMLVRAAVSPGSTEPIAFTLNRRSITYQYFSSISSQTHHDHTTTNNTSWQTA
jgi:hypothetical protein